MRVGDKQDLSLLSLRREMKLVKACRNRDIKEVKYLLDTGGEKIKIRGYRALTVAVNNGDVEIVKALVNSGIKQHEFVCDLLDLDLIKQYLDARSYDKESVFYVSYRAIKTNNVDVLKFLVENNQDLLTKINLPTAISCESVNVVEYLLSIGADIGMPEYAVANSGAGCKLMCALYRHPENIKPSFCGWEGCNFYVDWKDCHSIPFSRHGPERVIKEAKTSLFDFLFLEENFPFTAQEFSFYTQRTITIYLSGLNMQDLEKQRDSRLYLPRLKIYKDNVHDSLLQVLWVEDLANVTIKYL